MMSQLIELVGKFLLALANTVAALVVVVEMFRGRQAIPIRTY